MALLITILWLCISLGVFVYTLWNADQWYAHRVRIATIALLTGTPTLSLLQPDTSIPMHILFVALLSIALDLISRTVKQPLHAPLQSAFEAGVNDAYISVGSPPPFTPTRQESETQQDDDAWEMYEPEGATA